MKLWILVTAVTETADVQAHAYENQTEAFTNAWLLTGTMPPPNVEDGQIVVTPDGWFMVQARELHAASVSTKADPENVDTAILGLTQLGFRKPKAEACVTAAAAKVGSANLDNLVTEALRQAA